MKKVQSQKNNTNLSSNNKFDLSFKDSPTVKRSATDYGKIMVEALKRSKDR